MVKGFNIHSSQKWFERTSMMISKKQINMAMQNKQNIIYIRKITETKSMGYILIDNHVFKAIIKKKPAIKIITMYPWKDEYKYECEFFSKTYNNKKYKITIFPDCYRETHNKGVLTKIFCQDSCSEIPFNHPFFNGLFNKGWRQFRKEKEYKNGQSFKTEKTAEIIIKNQNPI